VEEQHWLALAHIVVMHSHAPGMPPAAMVLLVPSSVRLFDAMNPNEAA
jgi:hypothetical protein